MVILRLSDHLCDVCRENMTMIAKDKITRIIDEVKVVRIQETWKCSNGHTKLKMYGEQPKIIVN